MVTSEDNLACSCFNIHNREQPVITFPAILDKVSQNLFEFIPFDAQQGDLIDKGGGCGEEERGGHGDG